MGAQGGNPLAERTMAYMEIASEHGPCTHEWEARVKKGVWDDGKHPVHRCGRYDTHGGGHKCNCGATNGKGKLKNLGRCA